MNSETRTIDMKNVSKISTKAGYDLSSNVYEIEELKTLVSAGHIVTRAYINRFSCTVVRVKVPAGK